MTWQEPYAVATEAEGVMGKITAFIETAKAKAADGLTWAEFGELLMALLRLSVSAADQVETMTGAAKKALVLEGVAMLFDVVADRCVPFWMLPVWALARSPVRALVLALASGAIEAVLPLVRTAA